MRYLRNIGIGSRLFAGFTIVLSLCIVITALAIWRLQVIDRATRDLMETPLLKERLISDLNANVAARWPS